jgi:ABC-type multidrug transport system fused ATPase/permease subunit
MIRRTLVRSADTTAWIDRHPLRPPVPAAGVLRWLLRHQWPSITLGTLAGTVWMGAGAAVPALLAKIIDEAAVRAPARVLIGWLVLLASVGVLEASAAALRHWHAVLLSERSHLAVMHLVASRALEPTGGLEEHFSTGDVVSRATSDAEALGGPVDLMCRGTGALATFVAVAVFMIAISPPLGLLLVVGLPVTLLVVVPLWRPLENRAMEEQETLAMITTLASDSITGLTTIKGLGVEPAVKAWYRERTGGARAAAMKVARLSATSDALRVVVGGVFLAAVAGFGGRMALGGAITPGELIAFIAYATFLVNPIDTLGEVAEEWAGGLASARRVVELLNLPPAVTGPSVSASVALPPAPSLSLRGVSLSDRQTGRRLLDHLDLQVDGGRRLGVVSTSQEADTALVDVLMRAREPDEGVVRAGDMDVRAVPLAQLRATVVVGERDAFLFAGTLRDNLQAGKADASPEELARALAIAAAEDIVAGAPDGLDLVVAERGRTLSGGQRQRVALARAVLTDAPVLVLVEPTNAVDAATEGRIILRLLEARAGRTTLIFSASPALLDALDEVVLLDGGRVVARGRHYGLLQECPTYRDAVLATPSEARARERT